MIYNSSGNRGSDQEVSSLDKTSSKSTVRLSIVCLVLMKLLRTSKLSDMLNDNFFKILCARISGISLSESFLRYLFSVTPNKSSC